MIIYLAGNGLKPEDDSCILENKDSNWGVLLSYKDIKTVNGKGSIRYRRLLRKLKKIKKRN